MRLIACPDCHTQYDVTEVAEKHFPCRCGATIENRSLEAVDARIHRCGSCGAIVMAEAQGCDYCGSAIERDPGKLSLICPECYARCKEDARFCTACGVAFSPEEVRLEGHELPCPVCDALMPPHRIGGIGVNECTGCNGVWAPGGSFDLLVSRAIEARRDATPEQLLALDPRVRGANPLAQKVQYRKCPECQAFMQRRNFRKSSGVIIDACHEHDRTYSPHTWTNGIGFYVNWNMALADRKNSHPLEYPLEEPSWIPEFREGIIDPILPNKNGMLPPFRRPGLGFEINKKKLRKYGTRFFKLTETGLKLKVIREKGLRAALDIKKRKDAQ